MNERRPGEVVEASEHQTNWTLIVLLAVVALLVVLVAYLTTRGNSDQDKLTNSQVLQSMPGPSQGKRCSSDGTYDLIKQELFRRAAYLRGRDQAAYDNIARFSVLRMEDVAMESQETSSRSVVCSGSASIEVPPGISLEDGGRVLEAQVDYDVDSNGAVTLRNVDATISALAKLRQVAQAAPQTTDQQPDNESAPEVPASPPAEPQATAPSSPAAPPRPLAQAASADPSFDCSTARRPGELAVCQDPALAALDRRMAVEYGRAAADASPGERDLLRQTAHRFYNYRDRCPDDVCIARACAGRMREIRDIVDGRWSPPR